MDANDELKKTFREQGFILQKGLAKPEEIETMRENVSMALNPLQAPLEYESDVGYPGAPEHRDDQGGLTPRRLLHAYSRDECFRNWAKDSRISKVLDQLFDHEPMLSQSHHNCIMTKAPRYSSVTSWHQDIRYWSYDRPELISVWLALGQERKQNGCLLCIPKSHKLSLDRGRLDQFLFLRTDLPENQELVDAAIPIELEPGDVLFFHSRLFHAAGLNQTNEMKWSLVFTYHESNNYPIPGTKSANYPSIRLF
jgi:phytanoyl-CoA hydroxylase